MQMEQLSFAANAHRFCSVSDLMRVYPSFRGGIADDDFHLLGAQVGLEGVEFFLRHGHENIVHKVVHLGAQFPEQARLTGQFNALAQRGLGAFKFADQAEHEFNGGHFTAAGRDSLVCHLHHLCFV